MRYEWDEGKDERNRSKHGVSFAAAALVFEDERCLVVADRVDETGEQRWIALGAIPPAESQSVVLFVVHVYREVHDGEEIIRIVSARRANKNEVRRYQDQEVE